MTDVTPNTPLTFGQSPLTGRIYAIRGNKREDVTMEFRRFVGTAPAPSDHISQPEKMVSDRERRLMNIIRGLVSHLELCRDMDFPGDTEEDKLILESVNAILGEARATLSPQRGGQKGEE